MPDRNLLTPERLADLLGKLNDVMSEATRLRREVTRQLDDQQRTVQQTVSQQKDTPGRKRSDKHR